MRFFVKGRKPGYIDIPLEQPITVWLIVSFFMLLLSVKSLGYPPISIIQVIFRIGDFLAGLISDFTGAIIFSVFVGLIVAYKAFKYYSEED